VKTFTKILREREGAGRLGRHVEHDPRSRAFSAGTAAIKSVRHTRHGKAFDQGELGSCTGNAMAGVLMTEPLWTRGRNLTEADAVALYKAATKLDNIAGSYPPKDTGSPGILGINWYSSFDNPSSDGQCRLTSSAKVRGGHEVELFGIDAGNKRVWCYNSWGPTWGGRKNGTFYFSWSTLGRLLGEQGDATFPRTT
jgi:hypothetical protein